MEVKNQPHPHRGEGVRDDGANWIVKPLLGIAAALTVIVGIIKIHEMIDVALKDKVGSVPTVLIIFIVGLIFTEVTHDLYEQEAE